MANKYFSAILLIAFVLVTDVLVAQSPVPAPNPPGVPIDGGVIGLLALGVGYAVKKIYDKSKG